MEWLCRHCYQMVHLVWGWGNEVWIGMEFYIHYSNVLAMDFFQLAKVLLFCGIGPKNICVLNEPLIHESDLNASQLFGHRFFFLTNYEHVHKNVHKILFCQCPPLFYDFCSISLPGVDFIKLGTRGKA